MGLCLRILTNVGSLNECSSGGIFGVDLELGYSFARVVVSEKDSGE
jgi:hypothetical protein